MSETRRNELLQLLEDIQCNAATGDPDWSGIEARIGEAQVWLRSENVAPDDRDAISAVIENYLYVTPNHLRDYEVLTDRIVNALKNPAPRAEQNAGERVSTSGRNADMAGGGTPSSTAAAGTSNGEENHAG